jgi:DHA1 family bicyclomycin/chloramphenicol resistance-like MFS transporter
MAALVLVTGSTTLSTDTYIAALPALRRSLDTTASAAQLTLTACILGMAIGQILIGPVTDARGRRRIALVAIVLFAVMSAVCAVASSAGVMIPARAVQGVACGAAACVGRAMVTDTWVGREAAAKFGTLTSISLLGPVAGPVLGGVLELLGGWRAVFWFLAVLGAAMLVAAWFGLPETLPVSRRQPGGLRALGARSADLLRDRRFIAPVITACLTTGGFFIYIGGSSIVLQSDLRISPQLYTVVFSVDAGTMILSSVLFRLLVVRVGPHLLRRCAVIVQTVAVLALLVVCLTAPGHHPALAPVWVCLAVMTSGLGTFLPANSSIAQQAGRRSAGAASALTGGLPYIVGSATTPLTGWFGAETVLVMGVGMAVFFTLAAIASFALRRSIAPDADEPGLPAVA